MTCQNNIGQNFPHTSKAQENCICKLEISIVPTKAKS